MKSNYELSKVKNLRITQMGDKGGAGDIETKHLSLSSVVWTRDTEGYDHVSVNPYNHKSPSWEAMCELKDIFFRDDEEVVQVHPKKSQYVNLLENCLHLWRRTDGSQY